MSHAGDPFYNRKPVPDAFIEHVGFTGLTTHEESSNRERKFSTQGGGDLRNFSNPKTNGKADPFYQRKPVPDYMIKDVGETGLTREEEYINRERKYSVTGQDIRKFSDHKKGWEPSHDPYYGRKQVHKTQLEGVGDTQMSKAEEFEIRENKESQVDFSGDPFQQITGQGHRASVSGAAAPVAAAARRRSSAVAPDYTREEKEQRETHHFSGYDGNQRLTTVESRRDDDEIAPTVSTTTHTSSSLDPASNLGVRDNTGHLTGTTGHTAFYDAATKDPDSVAPHERA